MATEEEVRAIWQSADAVCFDVDSTVCMDEAIDELSKFCGKGQVVAAMTKEVMGGKMGFREALSSRLGIIHPSLEQVRCFIHAQPPRLTPGIRTTQAVEGSETFNEPHITQLLVVQPHLSQVRELIQNRPLSLTPGIRELVNALHARGTPVYLISGGFRSIIGPVAMKLKIPLENIFANRLKFYYNGDFAGFDENEPTSQSGGKGAVIRLLKEKFGYGLVVMIGDGLTDLEASPPADAFIGFGGNVVRDRVKERAEWYIMDFDELLKAL